MGFLSNFLNPIKGTKTALKATAKGDIGRALDPAKIISKETQMEKDAKKKLLAPLAERDRGLKMPPPGGPGAGMAAPGGVMRGTPINFGGAPGGRTYTPNPFSMAPPPQQPPPQAPAGGGMFAGAPPPGTVRSGGGMMGGAAGGAPPLPPPAAPQTKVNPQVRQAQLLRSSPKMRPGM
jgi:hypothetical protein